MDKYIEYDRLKIGVREWALDRALQKSGGIGGMEGIIKEAREIEKYISRDITPLEINPEKAVI